MNWIQTSQMGMLERFLDLAVLRQSLIASNMANIDTPQHRTVDIDFKAELRRAVSQSAAQPTAPVVQQVRGLIERPDGNNVSLERETMSLAETQMKFQAGTELIRTEFRRLLSIIHEGRGQ